MAERVFEKNPGPDWRVIYVVLSSGEQLVVSVFGQETIEDALKEARRSLNAAGEGWYRIIAVGKPVRSE